MLLLLLGGRVLLLLLLHHQLLLLLHKLHLKRLLLLRSHEGLRIGSMGLKSELLLLVHHLLQKRDCMSLAGYVLFHAENKKCVEKGFIHLIRPLSELLLLLGIKRLLGELLELKMGPKQRETKPKTVKAKTKGVWDAGQKSNVAFRRRKGRTYGSGIGERT